MLAQTNQEADRTLLDTGTHPAATHEAGPWLWAMEEMRAATLDTLERIEQGGLGQEFLDWRGADGRDNSVATVLYHVAHVEVGWLYYDMLGSELPADMRQIVPEGGRDEEGRLPHIPGLTFEQLREKLALTRERFLQIMSQLTPEEWRTASEPEGEDYAVTPAWIAFHLLEHEAGHLYEVRRMVRKWLEHKRG